MKLNERTFSLEVLNGHNKSQIWCIFSCLGAYNALLDKDLRLSPPSELRERVVAALDQRALRQTDIVVTVTRCQIL